MNGTYRHSLDPKNRLTLPSKLRLKLDETVYVSYGPDGCLEIRSPESFNAYVRQISNGGQLSQEVRQAMRTIFSLSHEIAIDKQNRILIPNELAILVNINKDVVLTGIEDKIEIWNPSDFEKVREDGIAKLSLILNGLHGEK